MLLQLAVRLLLTVAALGVPIISEAECVTIPAPEGSSTEWLSGATLVFTGTVQAAALQDYLVVFEVDRVWVGRLQRQTTLFVLPELEGITALSFQPGRTYLVVTHEPIGFLAAEERAEFALPAETMVVRFGFCSKPIPIEDAAVDLKRLGRGRAPLP